MTYLIDSSVWIEFFRSNGSPSNLALRRLVVDHRGEIRGCPPVRMELACDPDDLRRQRFLRVYDGFPSVNVEAGDFDFAANVYRAVRRAANTVRGMNDCVIVAMAVRTRATLVHNDVDFDRVAGVVTELRVLRLPD